MNKSPSRKTYSPESVAHQPGEMDFPTALRAVMVGNRVTKKDWEDPTIFLVLQNERLKIHQDNKYRDLIVSEGDLFGEDWVVLDGPSVDDEED